MTFDAGDEEFINVCLRVLNKVWRGLFCRDSDERYTLICRFEPNNLGSLNRPPRFVASITLTLAAFSFLFFLCRSRGRPKKSESTGEELARHPFDNSHNMTSELRLYFVGYSVNISICRTHQHECGQRRTLRPRKA